MAGTNETELNECKVQAKADTAMLLGKALPVSQHRTRRLLAVQNISDGEIEEIKNGGLRHM